MLKTIGYLTCLYEVTFKTFTLNFNIDELESKRNVQLIECNIISSTKKRSTERCRARYFNQV